MLVLSFFLLLLIPSRRLDLAFYATVGFFAFLGCWMVFVFWVSARIRRWRIGAVTTELRIVDSTLSVARGDGRPSTSVPVDAIVSWQRWSGYLAIALPSSVLLIPLGAFFAGELERLEDLLRHERA